MPQENSELRAIKNILAKNIRKNFVQRVFYPNQYPKLYDNPDPNEPSTHSMAYATGENGKAYVYPTVVMGNDGQLVRIKDFNEAWNHAKTTGEYIEFDSEAKANWFSKNYKKVWEQ